MSELVPLTLFGGKRYCGDRKFAVSKVFLEGSIGKEYMAESDPLVWWKEVLWE